MNSKINKNNTGFSIVELIIVIAIMAIIIGITSPMFLKYVTRSKRSVDVDTAREIAEAVVRLHASEEYHALIDASPSLQGSWNGSATFSATPSDWTEAIFVECGNVPTSKVNSNYYWIVKIDSKGLLENIYISTVSDLSGTHYEVWPESDDYYENGPAR